MKLFVGQGSECVSVKLGQNEKNCGEIMSQLYERKRDVALIIIVNNIDLVDNLLPNGKKSYKKRKRPKMDKGSRRERCI